MGSDDLVAHNISTVILGAIVEAIDLALQINRSMLFAEERFLLELTCKIRGCNMHITFILV